MEHRSQRNRPCLIGSPGLTREDIFILVQMAEKVFIETFDHGPCGWINWGSKGPFAVEIHDSIALSRSPWWVDYNHGPPGAGYLHMPFMLHLRPEYREFPSRRE